MPTNDKCTNSFFFLPYLYLLVVKVVVVAIVTANEKKTDDDDGGTGDEERKVLEYRYMSYVNLYVQYVSCGNSLWSGLWFLRWHRTP